MTKNRERNISVLICGSGHARSLVKNFEDNEVSYIVLEVGGHEDKHI